MTFLLLMVATTGMLCNDSCQLKMSYKDPGAAALVGGVRVLGYFLRGSSYPKGASSPELLPGGRPFPVTPGAEVQRVF